MISFHNVTERLQSGTKLDIDRVFRGTAPVGDRQVMKVAQNFTGKGILSGGDWNPNLRNDFLSTYIDWISSCTVAPVKGLNSYAAQYFVNGVTQAYDIFYSEHRERRFRTLAAEYPYTRLSMQKWALLQDVDDLQAGDALVMSMPYYVHGGMPRDYRALLDRCQELSIPVMIDAAYYGTCYGVSFDYDHPAIDMVGFSLSKPFGLQSWRIGMMLSRRKLPFMEEIQVQANYFNKVGAYAGLQHLRAFKADYMPMKYQAKQRQIAYRLGLLPSDCIMLALVREDDRRFDGILQDDRFEADVRPQGQLRRVCISSYVGDTEWWPKRLVRDTVQGTVGLIKSGMSPREA